jgi:hypothetical protein
MKNSIKGFFLSFPERSISRIRFFCIVAFFLLLFVERYNKLGLELSFVIITLILWIGGVFPFLWQLVQYQSVKKANTIGHKILISLLITLIILLFAGPIFCYWMAIHSEIRAEYYRSFLSK